MSFVMLTAAPDVRDLCPADVVEGKWLEVPSVPIKIVAGELEARATGKVARREDLMSAPVFEYRRREAWEGTNG